MTIGYIYLITNTVNGKRYVGQTTNTQQRWRQHIHSAKHGSAYPIHAAIRKYGVENFALRIVENVVGDRNNLLSAEVRCIQQYGSLAPNGYNLTSGGEGVDFGDPVIRERHLQAVRKFTSDPTWQMAQFEGAQKRLQDPEWCRRNREALEEVRNRPEVREKVLETLRYNLIDLDVRSRYYEGIRNRSLNVGWRAANAHVLAQARALRTQQALERDGNCPPEEADKRKRQREATRRYRARKKSQ